MKRQYLRIACASIFLCAATGAMGATNVFGPRTFTRSAGAPQTFTETFAADAAQSCSGKAAFIAVIENGAQSDAVDSGEISLNGTVLLSESDFQQGRGARELPVPLGPSNTLQVTLKGGRPGSAVTISIRREIHEDLVAPQTHTLSPKPTTFTQSIQLASALSRAAIVVRLGNSRPDSFAVRLNGSQILNTSSLTGSMAIAYAGLQTNNTLEVDGKGRSGDTIEVGVARVSAESTCGPSISIDSPAANAVINSARVVVIGKVIAQTRDIGVTVNNRLAEVDLWHAGTESDPFRFVATIDARSGAFELQAVVRDTNGGKGTASRSVIVSPAPQPFELRPDSDHGVAPFAASFSVVTETPERVQSFDVDYNADGAYEISNVTSFETALTYNYATPGIYTARLRVRDVAGATFLSNVYVTVQHPAAIDAAVQARWKQLRDAFAAQDVEGAVMLFSRPAREKYRVAFTTLFDRLPAIAAGMSSAPAAMSIQADYVDYLVTRVEDGKTMGYRFTLMRDAAGLWKIADF